MRLKILASITLAGALGLIGCSGSSTSSSSSSAAATTTSGGAVGGTTSAGASSGGSSGTHASSSSGGAASSGTSAATTGTPTASASSSGGAGTTTSSSGAGTSGSNGTTVSSNGTTGGSGGSGSATCANADAGSPGTADTDCGCSHDRCNDGQHCLFNPSPGGSISAYWACACTEEDSQAGTADSCRTENEITGGNGKVVCDSNTLDCRAPRDFELINFAGQSETDLCAPGFTVVHFVEPLPDGGQTGFDLPDGGQFPDFPDGGYEYLCVETCTAGTSNCSATWTHCEADFLVSRNPDGGADIPLGACVENDCGPDLTTSDHDGGTVAVDGGQYFGTCQADTSTGFCQPFPATRGGFVGICFKTGTATSDQPCTGWFGQVGNADQMCAPGSICVNTGLAPGGPIPAHLCSQSCDVDPVNIYNTPACADVGGQPTQCHPLFNSNPPGADFQPGICY